MCPIERPALCVAIHDVAPATWPECLHLLHAIRAVADIPLSWLVVPRYHGSRQRSRSCEATLEGLMEKGHELVLHGLTHQDSAPLHWSVKGRLLRTVYARREGEFAALGADEARLRLELGLAWFAERRWPVHGFVAPAWLLSSAGWHVLREYPIVYTTTYSRFHLLQQGKTVFAPALVYAARNRIGRCLSPPAADGLAAMRRAAPLARVALHPRDAHHPGLILHAQRLIARLLASREAVTKTAFAAACGRASEPGIAGSAGPMPP